MVVKFFRNPFVGSSPTTKLSCFFSQRTNFRRVSMRLEPQLTQNGTKLPQDKYFYLAGGIFTCCEPPPNLRNREILLVELVNQIVPAETTPYGKRRLAARFPHNGRVNPFPGCFDENLFDHAA